MRTTEERLYLIEQRRIEIKNVKKRQKIEMLCMAASLLFLVGAGAAMPGILAGIPEAAVGHTSGAASILGSHESLGYILMGILSFLLGMCVTMLLYQMRKKQERARRKEQQHEH